MRFLYSEGICICSDSLIGSAVKISPYNLAIFILARRTYVPLENILRVNIPYSDNAVEIPPCLVNLGTFYFLANEK